MLEFGDGFARRSGNGRARFGVILLLFLVAIALFFLLLLALLWIGSNGAHLPGAWWLIKIWSLLCDVGVATIAVAGCL